MRKYDTSTHSRRKSPPIALTVAGSDSGGGAGIQADLRTFAAFGVHGLSAITAVTAQNTLGVDAVHRLPRSVLGAQLDAVFADFRIGAVKIGMLASANLARETARVLREHPHVPVVLDPVLIATTGAALAREDLVESMRRHLFARADLLTPNVPEAQTLIGRRIGDRDDMRTAAVALLEQGARAVLLKGGHLPGGDIADLLLTRDGEHWFHQRRIRGESHGTGCSLAAAIAAGLACGDALETAVEQAIGFVHAALAAGYRPGRGRLRALDHLGVR